MNKDCNCKQCFKCVSSTLIDYKMKMNYREHKCCCECSKKCETCISLSKEIYKFYSVCHNCKSYIPKYDFCDCSPLPEPINFVSPWINSEIMPNIKNNDNVLIYKIGSNIKE